MDDVRLLLRDFGSYGLFTKCVCYVITVAMVMLLRDFGPYGIIVMTALSSLDFPVIIEGVV
jgi:hypothetical protein